jgi:hypothetical protein
MEKINKVSIWIGNFKSENDFNKYIEEKFDKKGNSSSVFMEEFKIKYINHDLQESAFIGTKLTKEDLTGASYAETFLDKLDGKLLTGNSIIMLYDFEYNEKIKVKNNTTFIGVFDYRK